MKAIAEKIKQNNPDSLADFQKAAQAFATTVFNKFDEFDFYIGESMNPG